MTLDTAIFWIGLIAATALSAGLIWSIRYPDVRYWPPLTYDRKRTVITWSVTFAIFISAIWLGVTGWNDGPLPDWMRWGVGLPIQIAGNALVWPHANAFGFDQTSGAPGTLQTDGAYRWSRNPQYLGDMAILIGWGILSNAPLAMTICAAGLVPFLLAPLPEERWMQQTYGTAYNDYRSRVRRWF